MHDIKKTNSPFTYQENIIIEKIFDMGGGYVLNFSDRTFQEFIFRSMGIDIYDEKYNFRSGSKANRLRGFWEVESNYNISTLVGHLLEYWKTFKLTHDEGISQVEENLYNECQKIIARLKDDNPVENLNSLKPNVDDEDFSRLSKSIKKAIEQNEPETALDRLHTFTVKYIRELCIKHSIDFNKTTPLHSLFGSYVKYLENENIIESEMAIIILKSSISVLDRFNDVRNNKSFAHDNKILNYNESILIFNSIANIIKYLETIENGFDIKPNNGNDSNDDYEELPF